MMPARPLLALLFAPVLATPGCCSLARLFCGPDKSPWVPVAYDTPAQTLATFLEAIRRDNAREVYFCLSRSYLESLGLPSGVGFTVAWERLCAEIPHLHLAGYLPVPAQPVAQQDQGVTYELDLDGTPLRVYLARQNYLEVRYRTVDGMPRDVGRYLDATLNGHLRLEPGEPDIDGEPTSRLRLELPVEFTHAGVATLPLEQFDRFAIGREWKIANLSLIDRRP